MSHLSFAFERVAVRDGWIIYAIFGVLVCLLLWRVATQWKVKSTEAENLRVSVVIFGVVALVLVVGQGVRQASPIAAHSQDKTITVFAAASTLTRVQTDVASLFCQIVSTHHSLRATSCRADLLARLTFRPAARGWSSRNSAEQSCVAATLVQNRDAHKSGSPTRRPPMFQPASALR
jgi:hypothetical protein